MKIVWEPVKYKFDSRKGKWLEDNEDDHSEMEDYDEEYHGDNFGELLPISVGNMVSTPFGLYEVDEAFNPLNHFEFWIGHTDFNLTQNFLDIADSIPGIEGIKVFSRYRFLITVGKLFEFNKVRTLLELAVGSLTLSDDIMKARKELEESNKDWYLYIYPDLKSYIHCTVDSDNFEKQYNKMLDLSKLGGILLSSNET